MRSFLWAALAALLASAAPAGAADAELDAWIDSLSGGWAGEDNATPFGRLPFAFVFDREPDGSLHARTALDRATWVDLRFAREADGRWVLLESAGLDGLGVQAHRLVPAGTRGGLRRWVHEERPEFLAVDLGIFGRRLHMEVTLRGEPHVQFDLERVTEADAARLRERLARAAALAPAEGPGLAALASDEQVPEAVLAARSRVAAAPADGRARLELAAALQAQIEANPARYGPRYAGEMLRALREAVDLAPDLPEAYHRLAGYYLEAPPIAGGSLERAEEVARRLQAMAPAAAEELLAEIARRRERVN